MTRIVEIGSNLRFKNFVRIKDEFQRIGSVGKIGIEINNVIFNKIYVIEKFYRIELFPTRKYGRDNF